MINLAKRSPELSFVVALLFFANHSSATIRVPLQPERAVHGAQQIAVVTITGAEKAADDDLSCGYLFHAEVLERMKGKGDFPPFLSNNRLAIGAKYLLFLSETAELNMSTLSTNSLMHEAERRAKNDRDSCSQRYSTSRLTPGYFLEFVANRYNEKGVVDQWLEVPRGAFPPEGLPFFRNYVRSVMVVSNEGTSEHTWEQHVADWDSPSPKYPVQVLGGTLVRWESYREWILQRVPHGETP